MITADHKQGIAIGAFKQWLCTDQIELQPLPGKPRAFPSWAWEFDLCLGRVGKFEPEVPGFKYIFFWLVLKSLTSIYTCISERFAEKKRSSKDVKVCKKTERVVKYQ